jgi:putative zinc finger protein
MDHRRVEDDALVERYVQGALAAEERLAFEEHLVGCPQCAEQVEWTDDFRGALRLVASTPQASVPRRRAWWPVAASLAAAAVLGGLLTRHTAGLRDRAARSAEEAAAWQGRYEAQRRESEGARDALRSLAQAQLNVPGVLLGAVRAASPRPAPEATLEIPPGAAWVMVSLELEPVPEHLTYRATLRDATERDIWKGEGLRPRPPAPATVLLPASLLRSGDHVLRVEGVRRDGRADLAGLYAFRVVRQGG